MGFDPRYLAKLEATGATSRGVNAKAFGSAPAVSTDLALILLAVEQSGYGAATPEHEFHPVRKWRFDAAWLEPMVALERHGGRFVTVHCECGKPYTRFVSYHHDRTGLENDAEKMNAAAALGWAVIAATPKMLTDGRALAALLTTLERRTKER